MLLPRIVDPLRPPPLVVATDAALAAGRPLWDDLELPPSPPLRDLDADAVADVCVVGLGASGLVAAAEAAALGADVLAIDATGLAAGAAGRNGGFLSLGSARYHHELVAAVGSPRARAIWAASVAELDRFRDAHPGLARPASVLRLAASPDEEGDIAAHLAAARADGLAVEAWPGPGVGLLTHGGALVNPRARVLALAGAAVRAGVRLARSGPVLPFGPEAPGELVRTAAGPTVQANHVFVCVDGGLEHLVPALAGVVRTTRLQMLATEPVAARVPHPISFRYGYEYLQQWPDGRLALGGFRDRFQDEEWDAPAEPSARLQATLEQFAREGLSLGARPRITHRWAGRVAYTETRLPVCRRVGAVWATGAYSGSGNLMGAAAARALVRAALTGDDAGRAVIDGA